MRERTKELISLLEHDPSNTDVITRLEELVSEDGVEEHVPEIKSEIHDGLLRLQNNGRYKAANSLIEIELALTDDTADEVELLIMQATILDEDLFDQTGALVCLERALKLDDTLEEVEEKIELMKAERERYEEISRTFKEQAESATDNSLKAHMLYSAAERLYKNDPQNSEIEDLLKNAMVADPLHHKAARLYERILEDASNWTELADLYQNLAKTRKGKKERISMYLAAGYTYGFRLEDVDSAALCYAEVLDYEPGHKKALHFLVDYYEKKEDWDSLVALYEDTLHGKLKPEDEIAACMQIGMVHWRFREDLESAEKYFKRLSKLAPAHPGMIEFYRKYCGAKNDNLLLLRVFENAVRFSDDPQFKEPLTKEIAKLSASDGGNVEKAIDAWKKVLRKDKGNREAIDELLRLYRQAGKWNNLIELLKSEADELDDSRVDDKIALYNEMVEIYRDELSLEMMVIKVYNTILALDPNNIDAIEKLQDAYEESGRWNDLIKVLSRRIEIVEDDEIKVSLLNKIASLWIDKFNNFNKAVEPLESIIEIKADDIKAIASLKEIYEKRRAWRPLQELLKKELGLADDDSKADILEQMAVLTAEKLNDRQEAIAIWWSVYEVNPQNDSALDNIEKLAEREKDWDSLGKVLRTLIDKASENDKVALLTKLGTVYKDRVKDPVKAAEVWKELLDVEPGNSKAMRSLKEAYQESEDWDALEKLFSGAGDYESLVEVLGIAADRVKDDDTKKMLSFRCADIYNEQIGQPDRAVRHYERVLTVEPDNKDAANALVPIYKNTEKWSRLSGVLEVVLESTEDKDERFLLIDELRELAVDKLNNREQAYRWAARAFVEMPGDESVRQTLEEAAEQAHAFDRLVDLYKQNIEQFDGADRAKLESHIASLSLEKLGNVEDAIKQYKEVLEENENDETALLALDSIYRTTSQWDELENIFTLRIAKAEDNEERKILIMDMASMYEDGMDNPEKAAENYKSLLSEYPDDIEVLNSLERIYQLLEKFEELASVIEAQKDLLTQGDEDWVEKTFQLARIYRNNLENKQRAIELYQEILDSGSGRDESIEALDEFLRDEKFQFNVAKILQPFLKENEDWRRLAWVLSILIENTPMGIERIELNVRLADLYGEKLNDERLSFETLGNTIKEAPNEMDLWDKLLTLSHRLDALDDGGQYLTGAYKNESIEESTRLELAKKLAELYGNEIGDQEKAEPFHEYILNESPDAVESFNALDQYYTAMEKWDELLLLFYNAKEKDAYTGGLLELQLKICFVLYEIQHDVENSIEAYKEVLEMDGENDEAYRALVSLYEEAGKWKDLSELYLDHLQRVDEQEAISLQYKIGEIAEKRLGNFEDAMDYYQLVIQRDPDNLKTQEAFERLLEKSEMRLRAAEILAENYEQQGAAEPLVKVLMIMLENEDLESLDRIHILSKVADVQERRLADSKGALESMGRALALGTDDTVLFSEFKRIAFENEYFTDYCMTIEKLADETDDEHVKGEFLLSAAKTWDSKLLDEQRAKDGYLALLEIAEDEPEIAIPAIDALDRILTGEEFYSKLIEILRLKVNLIDDPAEQKDILFRMADIEETILEKSDNALALLKEILEIDETEMRALMALERIYSINEKWIELISVLQSRITYENDNEVRLELMLRVAELFEKELDDTDKAINAYTQINEEIGVNITALKALEKLYKKGSRWSDLFESYETWLQAVEDTDEISDLNFKMGEILRKHLNEPEQSVEFYKNALDNNPDNDKAKESLEKLLDTVAKVMAVEVLAPIASSEGDHEKQLKFLLIMATDADDHMDKSNYYKEAGELAEMGLDKVDDAFDYYIEAVRFGASSEYLADLMKNVQRLLDTDDKRKKLVSVYSEIASDILDAEIQVSVLQEVAEISFRDLGDIDTAKDFYLKIMDADAENDKAMNALEEIYQEQKDYLELFEIYRQKVHSIYDDDLKIDILFKQAAVCENHLDDLSTAVSTYESILEIDTVNKSAIESLERLYPKEDRWADLMELLNQQRDNDPDKRVELSHRMGEVAKEKLGDEDQALMYFKDALDEDIEYKPTIDLLERYMEDEGLRGKAAEILEPVYSNQGNWESLARVLDARIEVCDDSIEKKELLARIGTVYEEQLGDLDKAFETFSRLFKEDHEDESSKELLLRICNILENWKELSEVLAEILENVVGDTQETSELSFMLGDLFENRLELPEKAIEYYRRVLSFAPDDPKAFDAVERMLLATKTWTELIALYRDATDAAVDMDKQKEFLFKMADIQEEHLEDIDAAINIYKEVLDIDDRDERSSNALDRIYFQNERFDDLADHFRNQIDMAEGVIQRNALRRELAKLYEDQINDFSSAVDLYEEAMAEPEGDKNSVSQLERLILNEDLRERIADILEPVYRETDEWKKLVVILNTQVSYLDNAGDKVEKLKEVAILHETRGQNILLAFNALAEAFVADPGDRFNYDEMIRLAKDIGNWEDVAAAIEPNIEEIFDIEFKKELLQVLGRIFDEQLDNPRKAIDAFTKVLEIDETDSVSLNALEGLYNLVGEWDGLIKVLGRKAEFESDPVEQSNLFRAKGAIEEELAARPEDALKSYEASFEADPQSVQAMISLERIYEQNKKWIELVDVTRQHFDIVDNLEQKKHLGIIIAKIYEDKLEDNFEAISAWKLILDEDPQDLEAIGALEKLYIKESNFVDLLENLSLQKELIPDQAAFVELSLRIGDLKKVELSDLDGAIMSYSDVLAQHPTNRDALERLEEMAKDESVRLAAIEVLEPLHKEAERFEKLIDLYELKLEIENDQIQRVEILLEIAGITQNGLSEPSKAFDVYVRALKEDPSRSEILDELQSIADAEGIYKRLCEVFESVAGDMYDQDAQNALYKRLGGIKEARLGDVKGAIDAYRQVFDNGDTSIDILSALDRLYEREEMWTELDEILEQEMLESSDTGVITQLKLRQAAIKEREFKDYSGAINVYRDILDVSYENVEAVKALEALLVKEDLVIDIADILKPVYEATGGEHKITKLIEAKLKIASDDTDRFEQYLLLASHQEQVLGDTSGAFDSYAKAFRIQPDNPEVLSELERLAETSGSWSALVDIAEDSVAKSKIDPVLKVDLGLKIASWAFNQVGDPRKAESLYRTVLEQDGEHLEALSALSNLLTGLGRFEDLLVIMQKQADVAYDFVDKKQILIHAADIAMHELKNVDKAINFYKQVLENDDSDLETLDALIDLTEQKENFGELVELIISRAQFTPDMDESARFRHRAATLFMGPLDDKDKAIDVYREILESNPLDDDAVNMLISVFENLERWTDLQEIYQHKLDNTSDDSQRIELMRSMAGLSEKRFEEYDDAVDKLQEIVLISPEDENAIKSLERVFTKQERWQDIIDLFEDQAIRASASGDGEKELSLLVKIGELYVDRLDDISGATDIYERVLERDSEHTGALNALAKLYEAQGDFEKVAEVLNRAVETAKPGVEQAEVHYRLARLSVSHLEDEAGAVEHLNKAVSSHSSHGDANKMLAEIARKLEDWTTLYGCLYRLVEIEEEPKDKIQLLLDTASVLTEHLNDASGAVDALQKAYELDNSNKDVLLRYSDALIDAGRQDDAIPVIKDLIDAETNGGKKRSKTASVYHQKLARAYESKGDQDQALENLEAAYKMDISNTEVLLSLGKLHYAREEYDKAAKLFRALLLQKFDSVMGLTKADVYFYVGDIQLKQGEPKKAKGMFRRGLDENKDHEGCKAGLEQC